jgi:hypothetical protein
MLFIFTLLIIAGFIYAEILNSQHKYLEATIGRLVVCISMVIWGIWVMSWLITNSPNLAKFATW